MNLQLKNFILTLIFAIILSLFLPWWSIMVAALISGFSIPLKKASIFFIPFLAVALLWIFHSLYLGFSNGFILTKKIAILLQLNGNTFLLILITGVIGGIAAGIAGNFGNQLYKLIKKES